MAKKTTKNKSIEGYRPLVFDTKGRGVLSEDELHKRYRLHQSGKSSAAPAEPSNSILRSVQLDRETGMLLATDFLVRLLGVEKESVLRYTDINVMYDKGDLMLKRVGKTIEVKTRAINPDRYPMNHVVLGVLKFDPRHSDGLKELAYKLGLDASVLEESTVREFGFDTKESYLLGHPPHFSLSSHSLLSSNMTIYVNHNQGHIYLYTKEEIKRHISGAIKNSGVRKGQGGEDKDSISVLIPLSRWRFTKDRAGLWKYTGSIDISVEAEKTALKQFLG